MGEVILFKDRVEVDPILRKGDLVRLVDMEEYAVEMSEQEEDEDIYEELMAFEGFAGIVHGIEMVLPGCHAVAPGQALYITVAVPCEDGYHEVNAISVECVRRILSTDAHALRGY